MIRGDLNRSLPFKTDQVRCVFALSVFEHLLNGCAFVRECRRVLEPNGTPVLLTPNISTFFTVVRLLVERVPCREPHPDWNVPRAAEKLVKVSSPDPLHGSQSDTPVHSNLVVFSFRVLHRYLRILGFSPVNGYGFEIYPFRRFLQPALDRLGPSHYHQMVLVGRK